MSESIRIVGAEGSPYSRKLRAILRFRRIPYRWLHQGSEEASQLPQPKVQLLPQLILRDEAGEWVARTDTTPLIRELEKLHPGRSVIPRDPALAFIDALLEDFADEWLTKAMFHYRWAFEADVANASKLLPAWFRPNQPDASLDAFGKSFADRQVGRLGVVGSNATTAPVIEESYRRILRALDVHLSRHRFVLGARPSTCDFALYGQLTQLTRVDPTAAALAHAESVRVVAWTDLTEDLGGREVSESDWIDPAAAPDSLRGLLAEAGRTYAPFMLGNLAALEAGAARVACEIDGRPWTQKPFPYQGKCVRWLRDHYRSLAESDRARVDALLAGSGCEAMFSG